MQVTSMKDRHSGGDCGNGGGGGGGITVLSVPRA